VNKDKPDSLRKIEVPQTTPRRGEQDMSHASNVSQENPWNNWLGETQIILEQNRTFVPLRLVSEGLGQKVE